MPRLFLSRQRPIDKNHLTHLPAHSNSLAPPRERYIPQSLSPAVSRGRGGAPSRPGEVDFGTAAGRENVCTTKDQRPAQQGGSEGMLVQDLDHGTRRFCRGTMSNRIFCISLHSI
jgi:hypothetical protein